MLETTECTLINNNDISYTDCMEFSFLRFIQLLLYEPKKIEKNGFSNYPKELVCSNILKNHVKKYQRIFSGTSYYLNEGVKEREEWATSLSRLDFMEYYRNDNCELYTNINNIFRLFNEMFFMKLDLKNEDKNFELIANKFSNKNKQIDIRIKERKISKKEMKMTEIIALLSRPEEEYQKYKSKKYIIQNISTIISIKINDIYSYEWRLSETLFDDSSHFTNKFITGHSVIVKIFIVDNYN